MKTYKEKLKQAMIDYMETKELDEYCYEFPEDEYLLSGDQMIKEVLKDLFKLAKIPIKIIISNDLTCYFRDGVRPWWDNTKIKAIFIYSKAFKEDSNWNREDQHKLVTKFLETLIDPVHFETIFDVHLFEDKVECSSYFSGG